jgi:hypothetical protein
MSGKVVILVPSQGKNIGSFAEVAQELGKKQYKHAVIVRTKLAGAGVRPPVTFFTHHDIPFSFASAMNLSRVITISHGLSDGPNLAFGASDPPAETHQPWGEGGKLNSEGQLFWTSVGKSLKADGKIILLGCFMGMSMSDDTGSYAREVAKAS